MKNWECASLLSLDLNETANGFFCSNVEICYLTHTHNGCGDDKKDPVTPDPTTPNTDTMS